MKKNLFILSCVLMITGSLKAQVGINTEEPQGLFHLDGRGDTQVVGSVITGDKDDVVVKDGTGRMGIGTIDPTELLEVRGNAKNTGDLNTGSSVMDGKGLIKGNVGVGSASTGSSLELNSDNGSVPTFKIEDTDFLANKYLTSDEFGNASWEYQRPDSKFVGIDETTGKLTTLFATGGKAINSATSVFTNITDASSVLHLTKGKWLIVGKYLIKGSASSPMLVWSSLRSKPSAAADSQYAEVVRFGNKPETGGVFFLATPQIFYLADITEDTDFAIFASMTTSVSFTTYINSNFGESFFVAIRLTDR